MLPVAILVQGPVPNPVSSPNQSRLSPNCPISPSLFYQETLPCCQVVERSKCRLLTLRSGVMEEKEREAGVTRLRALFQAV